MRRKITLLVSIVDIVNVEEILNHLLSQCKEKRSSVLKECIDAIFSILQNYPAQSVKVFSELENLISTLNHIIINPILSAIGRIGSRLDENFLFKLIERVDYTKINDETSLSNLLYIIGIGINNASFEKSKFLLEEIVKTYAKLSSNVKMQLVISIGKLYEKDKVALSNLFKKTVALGLEEKDSMVYNQTVLMKRIVHLNLKESSKVSDAKPSKMLQELKRQDQKIGKFNTIDL